MNQKCYLFKEDHIPLKARFPVIDAHNHLWGNWRSVANIVEVMDDVGVESYCDLTANVSLEMRDGGYQITPGDIDHFLTNCAEPYPGRFYCFTTATFAEPYDKPFIRDYREFVERTIELLHRHVDMGAKGLKVLKELGLRYRDSDGNLIRLNDERLAPIWEAAGDLGIPVLIHQSDPYGFFESVVEENEHYDSLLKYHDWSFCDPKYPSKSELLKHRDEIVRNHPNTIFMLPHVANFAENLEYVGNLINDNPNVYIDFSARIDELGRQPYSSRKFMIDYQDRIYFGADLPVSRDVYRCYFRFLETYDEYFIPPDYDGTFDRFRWRIYGLGLPDDVLKKIYHENIQRIITM
ncbi:MAG: amidohydrolase family protein [Kiritimatiellaeota bacterium]|nr:amidohydrolase family protein [Kiritimatiellota bacterium]